VRLRQGIEVSQVLGLRPEQPAIQKCHGLLHDRCSCPFAGPGSRWLVAAMLSERSLTAPRVQLPQRATRLLQILLEKVGQVRTVRACSFEFPTLPATPELWSASISL
jgi:hypothetical protein